MMSRKKNTKFSPCKILILAYSVKHITMIFEEQISRKPNLYPWTEQFIEAMHNGFWTDKEFSFKLPSTHNTFIYLINVEIESEQKPLVATNQTV